MPQPNFMLLYVDSPQASARFYGGLLGREPVEASPTFVLFALESGLMLGLWSRHLVKPNPAAGPGGAEIVFPADDAAAVGAVYQDWKARDVAIAQEPTQMDFGLTFVGLDPDGHRLRVFAPSGQ
jgi:catechol 2,3-dioxygenase-like lactoylglutathione lyase family enzyme